MDAKLLVLHDEITEHLEAMIARKNAIQGYLNRNVVRQYRKFEKSRWMTENSSEGKKWTPLKSRYAATKIKRFKDYPGAGRKMLVATGRLSEAYIKGSTNTLILTSNTSIEIGTSLPYAEYVQEARDFVNLSDAHMTEIYEGVADFLMEAYLG